MKTLLPSYHDLLVAIYRYLNRGTQMRDPIFRAVLQQDYRAIEEIKTDAAGYGASEDWYEDHVALMKEAEDTMARNLPTISWGSREKVQEWVDHKGLYGVGNASDAQERLMILKLENKAGPMDYPTFEYPTQTMN